MLASLELLKYHKKTFFAVQIESKNSSAVGDIVFDVRGGKINCAYPWKFTVWESAMLADSEYK